MTEPLAAEPARPDEHGVVRFSLAAAPGVRPAMDARLLDRLDHFLGEVELLAVEGAARAVLLHGAPGARAWLAGTDLAELAGLEGVREGALWAARGQRVLRRLESLPVPTVAAIDGSCHGAGLELALACAYRLATATPRTQLGFPEVRLGLIPGLGGTVRLPRLIGVQRSLELILTARPVGAAEAAELGLVDEPMPAEGFAEAAERFARERIRRGRIRTGARRRIPRRLLEDTAPGRRLVLARAARRLVPAEGGSAHRRALEAVADGVALPLEQAFRHEAELFGRLLASGPTRALLYSARLLQHAADLRPAADAPPVAQAAVLGAGEIGSQFAYLLARAGIPLRLKDRRGSAMRAGAEAARARLKRDAAAGELAEGDAAERGALVDGVSGFGGFGTADLVVAAVGDRPQVVTYALQEAEDHVRAECILAVTSPLVSVGDVQNALVDPTRSVGLRLALPADTFPLVEVVAGEHTTDGTVQRCLRLARRLGRTPIRVADRPGGVTYRLLAALFSEALHLLAEGMGAAAVDRAAERFGMTMGPLRRIDQLGAARVRRLLDGLADRLGERFRATDLLEGVIASGDGFFRYRRGVPLGPNPILPAATGRLDAERETRIRDRLLLRLIVEAARLLEEGVAPPVEVELAALFGVGFPRERGGLLFLADRMGAATVVDALDHAAQQHGERFTAAPLLQRLAQNGGRLHTAPPSGQPAAGVLG